EVQHEIDGAKRRRWPLVASVQLDEHQAMGELIVRTHRRRAAGAGRQKTSFGRALEVREG
ncbi:MAG: hypothetical protein MUF34_33265, partial [Polyangiaceae bacterium]|nr:hypothetical protein [Polyangiaceae bacterium]